MHHKPFGVNYQLYQLVYLYEPIYLDFRTFLLVILCIFNYNRISCCISISCNSNSNSLCKMGVDRWVPSVILFCRRISISYRSLYRSLEFILIVAIVICCINSNNCQYNFFALPVIITLVLMYIYTTTTNTNI